MKILILSDIHGNLNALTSVLNDAAVYPIEGLALLGDLIDYGMHSNEVVNIIKNCNYKVLCNIRGNHEQAVMEENR
ncbi:MAG: metallophosphoesterase family protein [Lachnospira sp.]|nr:metallophosphoesterase family protein [Lachnospira sp.]